MPVGWHLTEQKESCKARCSRLDLVCNEASFWNHLEDLDTAEKMSEIVKGLKSKDNPNLECAMYDATKGTEQFVPSYGVEDKKCYVSKAKAQRPKDTLKCEALGADDTVRLCYCDKDANPAGGHNGSHPEAPDAGAAGAAVDANKSAPNTDASNESSAQEAGKAPVSEEEANKAEKEDEGLGFDIIMVAWFMGCSGIMLIPWACMVLCGMLVEEGAEMVNSVSMGLTRSQVPEGEGDGIPEGLERSGSTEEASS